MRKANTEKIFRSGRIGLKAICKLSAKDSWITEDICVCGLYEFLPSTACIILKRESARLKTRLDEILVYLGHLAV